MLTEIIISQYEFLTILIMYLLQNDKRIYKID
jgi:hypothetical protein